MSPKGVRIIAAVLCLPLLFFCTPVGMIPVALYGVYLHPRVFARNIERGEPLVQAVNRYRTDTGLYPEKLDDLVPAYLLAIPAGWTYRPALGGRPPTLSLHGSFHSWLTYYFPPATEALPPGVTEGWSLNQEGALTFLGRARHPIPPVRLSGPELDRSRVSELRRRVERRTGDDESLLMNYKKLVSELVRLDCVDEARAACRACIGALPRERWCRMALAELGMRVGSPAEMDEFVSWSKASPSFAAFCHVALLRDKHGQSDGVPEALREAVKYPLAEGRGDSYTPEFYAFQAALLAYRNGQYDLALAVCDRWEDFVKARGWGERSYHALRAASYLAAGRRGEAAREVALAEQQNREGATWAGDVGPLKRTIAKGDRGFVYDRGGFGTGERLFLGHVE